MLIISLRKIIKPSQSANHHQITIFFFCLAEENECAGINYSVIQKHRKKILLMRILTQRVAQFFCNFKMFPFRLKYPCHFNKKMHILQKNSGWQAWQTFWSMHNVLFLRDTLYFYDFGLYKTQKTRVHSLQNLGVILIGWMIF